MLVPAPTILWAYSIRLAHQTSELLVKLTLGYIPDSHLCGKWSDDVLTCVGIVNSTVNDIVVVNVVVSFDIDPFIIFGTDDNGFSFANLNVATNDVVTDFTDFFRTAAELSKRI
ncbi:6589_t:CDS:2 [Entrophospora sp. SA101]|nr:3857_t:CDS:2 [Entrophospora sp. SA101]CAJ0763844.1 6589_t:CDS:2 [Entrophospora sp. SA101]